MALVIGTNCGFVTTAPTADPSASNTSFDTRANALKDTSPNNAVKITEIGWWCDNATEESNFEVGLYDNNSGRAGNRLYVEATNAKGTDSGWKTVTVNWNISESTIYWIGVQLDDTSTTTNTNGSGTGGPDLDVLLSATTLTDPFNGTSLDTDGITGVYAVIEGTKIPLDTRFIQKNIASMGNTCTITQVAVTIGSDEYRTVSESTTDNTSIPCFVHVLSYEDEIVKQGAARNGDLIFWFDASYNSILARSGNDVVRISWNSDTYEVKDIRPYYAIGDTLYLLEVRVSQI